MRAYITSFSAISPQSTFEGTNYLKEIKVDQDYFTAIEPDYKAFIDPKLSRRMARIIKMSVATAQDCLSRTEVTQPDGIIVGTGLGCLQDTERFLADLIENNEGLLSPTAFIQSTHNTIAGQIALILGCPNHNFTFVQRGHSFENALQDALLQLEEGGNHILIGGVDEVTPALYTILNKTGCIASKKATDQKPVWGEGASFFLLSSTPSANAIACIEKTHFFYGQNDQNSVENEITQLLQKSNRALTDIDAVMMGFNGNEQDDVMYRQLQAGIFKGKSIISFKNLCGEYFTATSFGLYLAANTLHTQTIHRGTIIEGNTDRPIKNILLYNHYKEKYHSLTLLSRC